MREAIDPPEQPPKAEAPPTAEIAQALDLIHRTLGYISDVNELDDLGSMAPDVLAQLETAADQIIETAGANLPESGLVLRRISNPIVRLYLFQTHLLPRFRDGSLTDAATALSGALADAGFSDEMRRECMDLFFEKEKAVTAPVQSARINPFGPVHRENVEIQAEHSRNPASVIAGEKEIDYIKRARARLENNDLNKEVNLKLIEDSQKELLEIAKSDPNIFFRDVLFSGRLKTKLEALRDQVATGGASSDWTALLDAVTEGKIGFEILEEMAEERIEGVKAQQRLFETQEAPALLVEFKEHMGHLIQREGLPITMEEVERRLSGIRIRLRDRLLGTTGSTGDYKSKEHYIEIDSVDPPGFRKRVLTHELLHAISGRTLLRKGFGAIPLVESRIGLRFSKGKKTGDSWTWLNEAMTEQLNGRLLGPEYMADGKKAYYVKQQQCLNELYDAGLSRELVDRAYFENHDPEDPMSERLIGWRAMVKALNEIFSQGGVRHIREIAESLPTAPDVSSEIGDQ